MYAPSQTIFNAMGAPSVLVSVCGVHACACVCMRVSVCLCSVVWYVCVYPYKYIDGE